MTLALYGKTGRRKGALVLLALLAVMAAVLGGTVYRNSAPADAASPAGPLDPIGNSTTHFAWTGGYTDVNDYDEVNDTCVDGTDTTYISSSTNNARSSFTIDLSDVPNGAKITSVDVTVCHVRQTGNAPANFKPFVRLDGTDEDGGNILANATTHKVDYQEVGVPDTIKSGATTMEVGVVHNQSQVKEIRVYQISASVNYLEPVPSGGGVTPIWLAEANGNGNPTCSDLDNDYSGDPGQTWLEFKVTPNATTGVYAGVYTGGTIPADHSITVYGVGDVSGVETFSWSSTFGIDAVFVKQASDQHALYVYDPPGPESFGDTGLTPQLGQNEDSISHINFCFDSTVTEPEEPALAIDKSNDTSGSVAAGGSFDWEIKVTVSGGPTTEPASITDTIPSGFTIGTISSVPSLDCSDSSGQDVVCYIPSGSEDGDYIVTVPVTAPDGDPGNECTGYDNIAYAFFESDPNGAIFESDSVEVTCDTGKIHIHKFLYNPQNGNWQNEGVGNPAAAWSFDIDGTADYDDKPHNSPIDVLFDTYSVTEDPAAGFVLVDIFPSPTGNNQCPAGPRAEGLRATSASVTVDSTGTEFVCAFNQAIPEPALDIDKTNDTSGTIGLGGIFEWKITVTVSNGPTTEWASITDTIPPGMTAFGAYDTDDGTGVGTITCFPASGSPVDCRIASGAGDGTYIIRVPIYAPAAGSTQSACKAYDNTAYVRFDSEQAPGISDTDRVTVTGCAQPSLAIDKTNDTDDDTVPASGTFDWKIKVTVSDGPTTEWASITDTIPAGMTVTGVVSTLDCSGSSGNNVLCYIPPNTINGDYNVTVGITAPNGKPESECTEYENTAYVRFASDTSQGTSDADSVTVTDCTGKIHIHKYIPKDNPSEGWKHEGVSGSEDWRFDITSQTGGTNYLDQVDNQPIDVLFDTYDITEDPVSGWVLVDIYLPDGDPTDPGKDSCKEPRAPGSRSTKIDDLVIDANSAGTVHVCAFNQLNSAEFQATKQFSDGSATATVSLTLTCTSGTVTAPATKTLVNDDEMVTWTVTGYTGTPSCSVTESAMTSGYTQTGFCTDVGLLSPGSCTVTNTLNSAEFQATKQFSDGSATATVSLTLTCTSGTVTAPATKTLVNDDEMVTWTVTGYTGTPSCSVTESAMTSGYTQTGFCTDVGLLSPGSCTVTNTLNSAEFQATKQFSDGSATATVSLTLTCTSGTVTAPATKTLVNDDEMVTWTVTGYTGTPSCSVTESAMTSGYTQTGFCTGVGLLEPGSCTVTNTLNRAEFQVLKDFSPNNTASVTIGFTCTDGTVTSSDNTASEADPADFTVTGFVGDASGVNCTATESATPGYIQNDTACSGVLLSAGTCTIVNTLRQGQFVVLKNFIPNATGSVAVNFSCTGGGTVTVVDGTASESDPAEFNYAGYGPGDPLCTATETSVPAGYAADMSACASVPFSAGQCTITNTRLGSLLVRKQTFRGALDLQSENGGWTINVDSTACNVHLTGVTVQGNPYGTVTFSNLPFCSDYVVSENVNSKPGSGFSVSGPSSYGGVTVPLNTTVIIDFVNRQATTTQEEEPATPTPTKTPTATPTGTRTPTATNTPVTPEPIETVLGVKTPGPEATPVAPSAGTGLAGGSGAAMNLAFALAGLLAVGGGMLMLRAGRRR